MLKVREGDTEAFAVLHERYQQKLLGFFYGLSRSSATANDLAQEAFLRVWQLRKRYRATGTFPAYLFAIARLIWQEQQRRDRKLQRVDGGAALEDVPEPVAPRQYSPFDRAARHETEDLLLRALEQLPEEQRLVFVLRHVRGLSLQDIAGALDCPLNTVRSRKILAVKKLRYLLAAELGPALRHTAKE